MEHNIHDVMGAPYVSCSKKSAHNKDKFARADKIARQFEELHYKFLYMAERGGHISSNARHAIAVLLMMHTGIRVGNESSAEGYMTKPHPNSKVEPKFVQTYGLTTLLHEHVSTSGNGLRKKVKVNFLGKKHVENYFELSGEVALCFSKLIDKSTEFDSEVIFEQVTPYTLTKFTRKYVGKQFSPKDFRTMRANLVASSVIEPHVTAPADLPKKERKEIVKSACITTSEALNNTPGVCKKSYIDTRLFNLILLQ